MPSWAVFPQGYMEKAHAVLDCIRRHDRFIVCAHSSPDGDATGSTAAFGYILKSLGKEFIIYNPSGLPEYLNWLPQPAWWHTRLSPLPFQPEVAIVLDCGEAHRTGEEMRDALNAGLASINIDHHVGNPGFGTLLNWVEPALAATGQAVAYVAHAAGVELSGDIAQNLGLALITDTGGFSHGNTTADVLALAAHMARLGLRVSELKESLENQWTLGQMHLWGRLLSTVEQYRNGSIALARVPASMMRDTGTNKEDLEGFVEMLRRLKGVKAAVMVREDVPGTCKFSLRSPEATDIRAAAAALGGGGHKNAAGGLLKLPLPEAAEAILQAVDEQLVREGS